MQRNPSSRRPPVLRQPAQQQKVVPKQPRRLAPKQAGKWGLPR